MTESDLRGITRLKERFEALPAGAIEDRLAIERGGLKDYRELEAYHYRSSKPATVGRVFVARHYGRNVADEFLGREMGSRVVGVLMESMPVLSCHQRDWALGNRYRCVGDLRERGKLLSKEMRCISRVVVHPQWRGLGIALRLVRAALEEATTVYTEALAAMGWVHPFFERAGMTAYRRHPHEHDARLIGVLEAAGIRPIDLAVLGDVWQRIEGLPSARKSWFIKELGIWYRKAVGCSSKQAVEPYEQLSAAQMRLVCEPVYYLKDNRVGCVLGDGGGCGL